MVTKTAGVAFYRVLQLNRVLWVVVLTAVFLFTLSQTIWQLVQPAISVTGTIVELREERVGAYQARYRLTLRLASGELTQVQLRNNGRILHHLLAIDTPPQTPITLAVQNETAVSFTDTTTIHEYNLLPIPAFGAVLLSAGLLLLFLRPGLLERTTIS